MNNEIQVNSFQYLRVSSVGQKDGDGYSRQHDTIKKYADDHNIALDQEFRDCFTGSRDGLDRPGLNDLFVAIKANGVRTVLVENATRIARDLMVGEIILAEFRKLGVKVISADGGVDLTVSNDDPTGKLVRQILSAVSEWEKCLLVQKMRVARLRKRTANGKCEGRKNFGHRPGESETLSIIKSERQSGATLSAIAARLNTLGSPTRMKGARWHASQVGRILSRV